MRFSRQYDEASDVRARELTCVRCPEPSLTMQSFAEDCDINILVKRFGIDAEAVPPQVFDARYYGDVSEAPDLRTILERSRDAREKFARLPVAIRRRFENNAANLWDFLQDPGNYDEAVQLGLLVYREEPASGAAKSAAGSPDSPPPGTGGSGAPGAA